MRQSLNFMIACWLSGPGSQTVGMGRDSVVARLASEGVPTYVEVDPGTVLGGLVTTIHTDAHVLHFGSPDELGAVMAACSISAEK
jgi:hypothetical protein